MTVLPEPDDSIIKFLEELLRVTLYKAGYTVEQIPDIYSFQFKFEKDNRLFDETLETVVFCKEALEDIAERHKAFDFSVVRCLQLSEMDARLYVRDYIRKSVSLDANDFREVFALCTAASLYYKAAMCGRWEHMYVVTSEWARFLAAVPLPGFSALFSFLTQMCDLYANLDPEERRSRKRAVTQNHV